MITKIDLYDLRLPLITPYGNSMGILREFTSVIAVFHDEQGNFGLGEATPAQPEYQEETPESVWTFVTNHAQQLLGKEPDAAYEYLATYKKKYPFACTSFMTAIEELKRDSSITVAEEVHFPLAGIINPKEGESLEEHVEKRISEGYKTLKVKVGYEVDKDIAKAKKVQNIVGDRAVIRFDANQAYTYEDAVKFVTNIDPYNVQLLEQPFDCGVWDAMVELKKISKIPLMLDESIYSEEDVRISGEKKCTDFIKFKLMKSASGRNLAKEITLAGNYGITALIGNGVSTDIGCYQESVIGFRNKITFAGEQNGFLKPVKTLFANQLIFENGNMIIPQGFSRELDMDVVEFYSIQEAHYSV